MKTKEVITRLFEDHRQRVSRYTIFKYERMGIINPHRESSLKPREYSHKDYLDITICVLLSAVGVPLDTVKDLLVYNDISVLGEVNRMIDTKRVASNKAGLVVNKRYRPLRIYH